MNNLRSVSSVKNVKSESSVSSVRSVKEIMGGDTKPERDASAIVRANALTWARRQIGSREYARTAVSEGWASGSYKCNKFIIDAFNIGNGRIIISEISKWAGTVSVYPRAIDFYNGNVPRFYVISKPIPGDVVSDGKHLGIVSGANKTISASSRAEKVIENDFGFDQGRNAKFLRYAEI